MLKISWLVHAILVVINGYLYLGLMSWPVNCWNLFLPDHFSWNNLLLLIVCSILNVKIYFLRSKNTANLISLGRLEVDNFSLCIISPIVTLIKMKRCCSWKTVSEVDFIQKNFVTRSLAPMTPMWNNSC